jgi:hypothetical protein
MLVDEPGATDPDQLGLAGGHGHVFRSGLHDPDDQDAPGPRASAYDPPGSRSVRAPRATDLAPCFASCLTDLGDQLLLASRGQARLDQGEGDGVRSHVPSVTV